MPTLTVAFLFVYLGMEITLVNRREDILAAANQALHTYSFDRPFIYVRVQSAPKFDPLTKAGAFRKIQEVDQWTVIYDRRYDAEGNPYWKFNKITR